jgi:hypothetical protein
MEEVHGQHRRGLRPQELSPAGIGVTVGCWWYPPTLEDPKDRGRSDAMAEVKQLALDALVAQV